jgi:hypothetical protein
MTIASRRLAARLGLGDDRFDCLRREPLGHLAIAPQVHHHRTGHHGLAGRRGPLLRAGRKSGSSSSRAADISGEIHPRILDGLDLRQGVAHLHLPECGTAAV